MGYTIKRLRDERDFTGPVSAFLLEESEKVSALFDHKYDWTKFNHIEYARNQLFLIAQKDGEPVGMLLAGFLKSAFDDSIDILCQHLLYTKSPGNRAAHLLMRHFIDFGKSHANHIVTMIGSKTNIKPRSLERLGFEKIEELYRIEV